MVEIFAAARFRAMELLTILNRCHRFRGFVYHRARFSPDHKNIEVSVWPLTKSSAAERSCRDALAQHARLFRLWHEFRGGRIDRCQLLRSIPIQKRIFELAEHNLQ